MSRSNFPEKIIYRLAYSLFAVSLIKLPAVFNPVNIIIIRQHNQFGDMLAGVSLFRGIKEKYPKCRIKLIAGPQNYYADEKKKFIDRLFKFNTKKL